MAVDWIKMRTDLYRDPKVCLMADFLMNTDGDLGRYVNQNCQRDMSVTRNVMRHAVVGALLSIWGVVRHRGKRSNDDLIVSNCSPAVVDDVADMAGFGEAMEYVGWVRQHEKCLVFPSFFEEYNADPAEESRLKAAERSRRYREKNRNVTRDVTRHKNVTLEKSREEKSKEKKKPPTPFRAEDAELPFDSIEFRSLWIDWCEHRREIKKPLTPKAVKMELQHLGDIGEDRAKKAIRHSMANSYQGIFEPTSGSGRSQPQSLGERNQQALEAWKQNRKTKST